MKTKNSFIFITAVVCAVLMLCGAFLMFFGISRDFDITLGYFTKGSVFAGFLYAVLALGAFGGVACYVKHRKTHIDALLPDGSAGAVLSCLFAVGVIFFTALDIADLTLSAPTQYATISYISWILAIPTAAGAILRTLTGTNAPTGALSVTGFFTPLYFASLILTDYFDHSQAINSPVKIIYQIALISFMLMFTAEEGLLLGRKQLYPRYLFTLCCSTVIGGVFGLGGIALCAMGVPSPVSVEAALLCFCTAVYGAGRLCCAGLTLAVKDEENSEGISDGEEA